MSTRALSTALLLLATSLGAVAASSPESTPPGSTSDSRDWSDALIKEAVLETAESLPYAVDRHTWLQDIEFDSDGLTYTYRFEPGSAFLRAPEQSLATYYEAAHDNACRDAMLRFLLGTSRSIFYRYLQGTNEVGKIELSAGACDLPRRTEDVSA